MTTPNKYISRLPLLGNILERKRHGSSSARWIDRQRKDMYSKSVRRDPELRSRSSFKLKWVQDKKGLIKAGDFVIDLGASPGGWSAFAQKLIKGGGLLVSSDLLEMDPLPQEDAKHCRSVFIRGDMMSEIVSRQLSTLVQTQGCKADVILSDMRPNTSGVKLADHHRSLELAEEVLHFAQHHLRPGGKLLLKHVQGADDADLLEPAKDMFGKTSLLKPPASRSSSAEIYLFCENHLV